MESGIRCINFYQFSVLRLEKQNEKKIKIPRTTILSKHYHFVEKIIQKSFFYVRLKVKFYKLCCYSRLLTVAKKFFVYDMRWCGIEYEPRWLLFSFPRFVCCLSVCFHFFSFLSTWARSYLRLASSFNARPITVKQHSRNNRCHYLNGSQFEVPLITHTRSECACTRVLVVAETAV